VAKSSGADASGRGEEQRAGCIVTVKKRRVISSAPLSISIAWTGGSGRPSPIAMFMISTEVRTWAAVRVQGDKKNKDPS